MTLRTIGLIGNPAKSATGAVAEDLVARLHAAGFRVVLAPELESLTHHPSATVADDLASLAQTDAVLILGGDGTLLHALRSLGSEPPPILGVNLGTLGFLTEGAVHDLDELVPRLASGSFTIHDRPLLIAVITDAAGRETDRLRALNDIVVDEGSPTRRAVRLRLTLGKEEVGLFTGDGIVVATPAGSTAYSLSAGGPILGPGIPVLVATPICPHTLSVRPLVYPEGESLTVEDLREGSSVKVTADGQVWRPVPGGGAVRVARDPSCRARFIHFGRASYYDVLRTKLGWGIDDPPGR